MAILLQRTVVPIVVSTIAMGTKYFFPVRFVRIRIRAVAVREGFAYYYRFWHIFTLKKSFAFSINYNFRIRAVADWTARIFFFNFVRSTFIRKQVNFISDNLV